MVHLPDKVAELPFEKLEQDYEDLGANDLRSQAHELIGIPLALNDSERRVAVKEWFKEYHRLCRFKGRGSIDESPQYMK